MQHLGTSGNVRAIPHVFVLIGRLISVPVAIMFTVVEWVIRDVVARIITVPAYLVICLVDEVRRAKLLADQRHLTREADMQVRLAVHRRRAEFVQTLQAVDRADRDLAQFTPMFEESLEAAQEAFGQQLRRLREAG